MKKLLLAGAALAAGLAMSASANAAVVLSDDFNSQPRDQLNWLGDSVFLPTLPPPSIDLIGSGGAFDFLPGHGGYLDLDGSTGSGNNPAGEIYSIATFGPGAYNLTFLLTGNRRTSDTEITHISLGTFATSITLPSSAGFTSYSYTFTTASAGRLFFTELGPSNQQGNLLDDVVLSTVPEPTTWAMMILGLGGAGALIRRRRSQLA